ncbi:von Willebrand factor, type A [Euzebya pacifica]|jgi:Ca-activated chloride channel family protein|uniref:von Willebrand factor, type A n=1 Tax=Euzebya pacifica TaxID=1608957 RepID=A0A346Y1I0_9ACTN|nr:VWA domain-containing protein [Euzebya pacifica]AXV08327.1 von Willebrand factor, type A [Euzebya pacifica]
MFAAPAMLLLVVIPIGLAIGYVVMQSRRSHYAVQFTNLDLLDEIAPDSPGWRRHVPAAALVLALICLVIAIARPVKAEQVPVEASTVILALDTSISMDARDVEPRRLDAAQAAALRFMDEVPDQVRVGLVSFAENAVANVAPTDDRAIVRTTIENLELRPGTAIGEALLVAVDLIEADLQAIQAEQQGDDEPEPATIIVLSDGDTTAGRPNAFGVRAAQEAGIAVSTISFGTVNGVIQFQGQIVPVPSNGRALEGIADDTGGRFYDADSAEALTEVFETLGVAVGFTTEEVEVIVPWVVAAMILGTAAAAASLVWFSRLP